MRGDQAHDLGAHGHHDLGADEPGDHEGGNLALRPVYCNCQTQLKTSDLYSVLFIYTSSHYFLL